MLKGPGAKSQDGPSWTEESREAFLTNITTSNQESAPRRKKHHYIPATDKHDAEFMGLDVPYVGMNSKVYNVATPITVIEEEGGEIKRFKRTVNIKSSTGHGSER